MPPSFDSKRSFKRCLPVDFILQQKILSGARWVSFLDKESPEDPEHHKRCLLLHVISTEFFLFCYVLCNNNSEDVGLFEIWPLQKANDRNWSLEGPWGLIVGIVWGLY